MAGKSVELFICLIMGILTLHFAIVHNKLHGCKTHHPSLLFFICHPEIDIILNDSIWLRSILFLQYRRLMRLEATYKYKKRFDARKSLAERKAREEADMPVDPLDDLFASAWYLATLIGPLLIPVMKNQVSWAEYVQISYHGHIKMANWVNENK